MNNLKRWFPILIIGGLVAVLLVAGLTLSPVLAPGPGGTLGQGMMGGYGRGGSLGQSMMGGRGFNGTSPNGYGPGWLRGTTQGFDGNMPCGSGSMMGGFGFNNLPGPAPSEVSAAMPLTPTQAVKAAQTYLDTYLSNNLQVDEHAEPFYGYYTLHVNRNSETIGMLSVNGYTGQVFLHTWHGDLVEMSGDEQ